LEISFLLSVGVKPKMPNNFDQGRPANTILVSGKVENSSNPIAFSSPRRKPHRSKRVTGGTGSGHFDSREHNTPLRNCRLCVSFAGSPWNCQTSSIPVNRAQC
jgi:hypothetical protein